MPIQLNRFEPGALQATAANSVPRYDLATHAILGGELLSSMTDQHNIAAKQAVEQQNANTDQSYKAGVIANAQAQLPIDQQKANADTMNAQANIGLKDVQAGSLKLQQQILQSHIDSGKAVDQRNQEQGDLAAGIVGMTSVQNDKTLDPKTKAQKLQETQKTILDHAYATGKIAKDEYTAGLAMPPSQFLGTMQTKFIGNKVAADQTGKNAANFDPMNPLASGQTTQQKPTADQQNAGQLAQLQANVDSATTPEARQSAATALNNFKAAGKINTVSDKVNAQTTPAMLKMMDKEADAATTDQVNNTILQNMIKDPDFKSGLLANNQTMVSRGLAAAASAVGVPYDPKTSPNEVMNDISTRSQIDFVKMIGQRINETEWKAAGNAVAHATNSAAGLQLIASVSDFNNEAKIQKAQFNHMYQENHNGSLTGSENAWGNYIGSLGSPRDPKTGLFIAGQKLREADYSSFATDPQYEKKGVVKPQASAGSFTPQPIGGAGSTTKSDPLGIR